MPKILQNDYTTIQTTIDKILSTGTGDHGYGQVPASKALSGYSGTITAQQWNNLRTDILKITQHIGNSSTLNGYSGSLDTTLVSGSVIQSSVGELYSAILDADDAQRLDLALSQSLNESLISSIPSKTDPWNGLLYQVLTVNFTDSNNARYFFNTGSSVLFGAGFSGFSGSIGSEAEKNTSWNNLLSEIDANKVYFSAHSTGFSGTIDSTVRLNNAVVTASISDGGNTPASGSKLIVSSVTSGAVQIGQVVRTSSSGQIPIAKIIGVVCTVNKSQSVSARQMTLGNGAVVNASISGTTMTINSFVSGSSVTTGLTVSGSGVDDDTTISAITSTWIIDEELLISSSTLTLSYGFYELSTTDTQLFKKTGISGYSGNSYSILARTNPARTQLTFTMQFNDAVGTIGDADTNVNGTLTSSYRVNRANGVVSVSKPVAALSQPIWNGGAAILPTYTVYPSTSVAIQGQTITYTVTTTNVTNNTQLYWEISGATLDTINAVSGNVTISSNTASIPIIVTAAPVSNLTLILKIKTNSQQTVALATAASVIVRAPTYTVDVTNLNREVKADQIAYYNVTMQNSPLTTLYWTAAAGPTTTFSDQYSLGKSGTITGYVSGTSGTNSFNIRMPLVIGPGSNVPLDYYIRAGSYSGTSVASAPQVTLIRPTYSIVPNVTQVIQNGNTSVTYNITTTNLPDCTLYWNVTGAASSNFIDNNVAGTVSIFNQTGTITRNIAQDFNNSSVDNMIMNLTSGASGTGVALASAATVQLLSPQYSVRQSFSGTSIVQGTSGAFNVSTVNVPQGTTVSWITAASGYSGYSGYSGIIADASDFTNGMSGSFNVSSTGTATIIRPTKLKAEWYAVSSIRWSTFMNAYAVWKYPAGQGTRTGTFDINFPVTGNYTINHANDDTLTLVIKRKSDNSTIATINAAESYELVPSTVTISTAEIYTLEVTVVNNDADVGGVAIQILKPDSSVLTDSRVFAITTPSANRIFALQLTIPDSGQVVATSPVITIVAPTS